VFERWVERWRFAVGVGLVAVAAAAFAVGFRAALQAALHVGFGVADVVSAMHVAPGWLRVALPALGGLCGGVLGLLSGGRAGGGVGNVMEAVALGKVDLPMRVTLQKSAASWLAIVSGGSIGREGPLIQFGGAVGKLVGDRLALRPEHTRILIAAGTAAGFASAYNTPFASVLFVLEIVTGVVVLDAILPALVATAIASALTRAIIGAGPIYGQRAFGAQGFMRLLSVGEDLFRSGKLPLPWRPALGGAACGVMLLALPEVAGNGYEPLNALLDARFSVGFVALLLVGKCVATTASVSSGNPGGVFTPTLLVGGALGYLYGIALGALGIPAGPPGGYALVGMAAASAATTHAPLMAAVLVFELSGDYAIVLPLVLATAVATLVSRWLRTDSIYAAELRERGVGWQMTMEGRRVAE
jgi:CIC family chloride channel protein